MKYLRRCSRANSQAQVVEMDRIEKVEWSFTGDHWKKWIMQFQLLHEGSETTVSHNLP
jgi:hypothetical protein